CAGGALGAGLRHLVNIAALRTFGLGLPWATFSANVVGSLVMGGLVAYLINRMPDAVGLRVFLGTGILGGFTTFSAFSLDAIVMIEQGSLVSAAIYVTASVVLSIVGCLLGYLAMRALLG
ncbi:MAG: CrcB family protein, partial [Hyphomicrobiaceae bacterium]